MHVLMTGAGGFIGKKLAATMVARQQLKINGHDHPEAIDRLTLFDLRLDRPKDETPMVRQVEGDIRDVPLVNTLIADDVDVIFHLAAIVSANAEEDFDLGMAINLDGTRQLLDACRRAAKPPFVVFASSVAVYGGAMPAVGHDDMALCPQTSYGAQKAASELLINDYSRKGFIHGRALRLPTIVVRPGAPNRAASTFASSIIREPLAGQRARCPVSPDSRMYLLSPRRVVEAFLHALALPDEAFGPERMLTLPGISVSIKEMAEALSRVAGTEVATRIDWQPDPAIQKIVSGWLPDFDAKRARALGFAADRDMEEIIRAHIEDEMTPGAQAQAGS